MNPKGPFRKGEALSGGRGVGEHVGNPKRYETDPTSKNMVGSSPRQDGPPTQGLGPGPASVRKIIEDERQDLANIRALAAPDDQATITPRQIGIAPAVRLDAGIHNRTSILIANMSNVVVWVNVHSQQVGVNRAYPLAPNAPAGAFNGGTLSMDVSERVEFWGAAAAGAGNLVVVIESAR